VNPQSRTSAPESYSDIPGFCRSSTLDEIRAHGHVLTPGRYVGAADIEDDGDQEQNEAPHREIEETRNRPSRENLRQSEGLGYEA
jgi:type I restriction-modification system DNA methylase subunit